MPEEEVTVRDVQAIRTRAGNTRFVVTDDEGREFSTFKEEIARGLPGLKGQRAMIRYHEMQRGDYTNVYLDAIEPLEDEGDRAAGSDAEEAAWRTAVDAAPYLLSSKEVEREVSPDELFDRLKPFKELVAEDIESDEDSPG